jgi:hypothetical protein
MELSQVGVQHQRAACGEAAQKVDTAVASFLGLDGRPPTSIVDNTAAQ